MGIIVLRLAILPFLGVGGRQLFRAEVPGPVPEKVDPKNPPNSASFYGESMSLTVLETLLLYLEVYPSLKRSPHLGTVATGGFPP